MRFRVQGVLRSNCNPHSRTSYYTVTYITFTLPVMIVFYVTVVRGALWVLRPALLCVIPKLKGRAFFDHAAHQRTNALSFDVRHAGLLHVMVRLSAGEL